MIYMVNFIYTLYYMPSVTTVTPNPNTMGETHGNTTDR